MHLGHRNTRNLSPCLVCVSVIVQKLVAEHQCDCQETVLATGLSLDTRVELFQAVDKQEGEDDDILCNLGGRENGCHPLAKACCRDSLGYQ